MSSNAVNTSRANGTSKSEAKTRQLPPLTADECLASIDMGDAKSDLKEYSF